MELKKISKEELKERLELHTKWLNDEDGIRLDLSYADLRGANLNRAYLSCAYLRGADLSRAYLNYTDLRGTDLRDADLSCAYLSRADLCNTDLSKTKFYFTNLYRAKGNFINVGNIGSRNDTTHYFYNEDRIICGCFDGTMEEFENRVKEEYEKEDKEYKQYMIAIDTLKKLAELEK